MSRERMAEIVAPHERISDKIRALHAAGFARSEIASFLGRRYQQVRNVIKDDERRTNEGITLVGQAVTNPSRSLAPAAAAPLPSTVRIASGGIIEIPSLLVEKFKLAEGDPLFVLEEEGGIVLLPREAMLARLKDALAVGAPEMLPALEALIETAG